MGLGDLLHLDDKNKTIDSVSTFILYRTTYKTLINNITLRLGSLTFASHELHSPAATLAHPHVCAVQNIHMKRSVTEKH